MRRALLLFPVIPFVLLACQPPAPRLAGSGMEMFTPVKVRLHPLSRVVIPTIATTAPATAPATRPTGNPLGSLEARLEFSDQFGDPTKGLGECVIELFDGVPGVLGGVGGSRKGASLATWKVSLNTPESNRAYWDRTTRTYLLKFPLPANMPNDHDRVFVTATLTLPNGMVLSDELSLSLR